ncbi:MAG: hypothetical protein LBH48_05280 [Bifidobacteriaceae bacterium]|nr:hypothetical protein [Bifidobacteriaceae bacterium]
MLASVGVAIPLVILTLAVWNSVPSFDGALNLQVAQSIADGDGFVRAYGGYRVGPEEIQTSGPFLLLQALAIRVLGPGTVVFQMVNLLALAVLAIGVCLVLRPWPLAQLIGPSLVLLALPHGGNPMAAVTAATGGYGEYCVAALAVVAFALLASGFRKTARRPYLYIAGAALCAGIAATVKVVALLIVPVLAVGLVLGLVARRSVKPLLAVSSASVGLVPVIAFELYRLSNFGSVSKLADFWTSQAHATAEQAGVAGDGAFSSDPTAFAGRTIFDKITMHWTALAESAGMGSFTLLVVVLTPLGLLASMAWLQRHNWRDWLTERRGIVAIELAVYCVGYIVWWVAITPTEKAWFRRIVVAMVCLILLYILAVCMALTVVRSAPRPFPRLRQGALMLGMATACATALGAIVALPDLTGTIVGSARSAPWLADAPNREQEAGIREAAKRADALAAEGAGLYGVGWWSAPVVELYSNTHFENFFPHSTWLWTDDRCSSDLTERPAYIVWDQYAQSLTDLPYSTDPLVTFRRDALLSNTYVEFYQIEVSPEDCAARAQRP